jgi:hypothetical protein
MSYFTRQSLPLAPAQKWDEADHPRIPAGQPGGGQFAGGGGGEGGGPITHHPVSFGSEGYGVERVEETGGKGLRARGALPERFTSMEDARIHADIMNRRGGKAQERIDTLTDMRRRGMHVPSAEERGEKIPEEEKVDDATADWRGKYRAAQARAAWGTPPLRKR